VQWQMEEEGASKGYSGILDTASPFLTVSGLCGELDPDWGCLDTRFDDAIRRERRAFEPTYEVYGLQDDGVTDWQRGEVVLPGEGGSAVRLSDVVYGASEGVASTRGGTAPAPMFGLVRDVAEGIRPSFLSQTDFSSFTVDFANSLLRLSGGEAPGAAGAATIPLVDLRPLGAPAFEYACRIRSLVVNGYDVTGWMDRPTYCVFDTGTTGMLVSRRLWEKTLFRTGVQQCALELPTADGRGTIVEASTRSCRKDCLLVGTPIDVQVRRGQ